MERIFLLFLMKNFLGYTLILYLGWHNKTCENQLQFFTLNLSRSLSLVLRSTKRYFSNVWVVNNIWLNSFSGSLFHFRWGGKHICIKSLIPSLFLSFSLFCFPLDSIFHFLLSLPFIFLSFISFLFSFNCSSFIYKLPCSESSKLSPVLDLSLHPLVPLFIKMFFFKWYFKCCLPFHSQVFISNSPFCLPHSSYDVTVENLILDQLIFPLLIFLSFFFDHLCAWYCTDIARRNSVLNTYGS